LATYIWQPWFVTTEGGVNFSRITRAGGTTEGDGKILGGDVKVGLLPASRYPSAISYSKSDSRVDGNLGSDFTAERINVAQALSLENGLRVQTTLSQDVIDELDGGEEEIRNVGLTATKSFGNSQFNLGLQHRESDFLARSPTQQDEAEELNKATLIHNYTPSSTFRMSNTVSYIQDSDETDTLSRDHITIQGVTTQQWRSSKSPFTINSALRVSREEIEVEGLALEEDNSNTNLVSGAVGMNYRINPRLTANFGLNGLYQDTERVKNDPMEPAELTREREREAGALSVISYLSLPKTVGRYSWRWNSRANAELQYRKLESDTADSEAGLDANTDGILGHTASRPIHVLFLGLGQLSLGQSIGAALTTDDRESDALVPYLAHDAAVTYSASREGTTTYLRFSLKDQREFVAEDAAESQLLLLQVNRRTSIDTRRNWTAALTAQAGRRKVREEKEDFTASITGNVSYLDQRLFNVSNLRFSSILELNAIGLEDVIQNNRDDNRFENERRADWTNRIAYRFGLITTSLEGSVFYVGEEFGNAIFFRIRRDFNGVF
jgi:hypothetical protein